MNVYEKLQIARIDLQSMEMKKSGHNKFAGYQYFELGDFLPQINKLFADLKLCSMISFGKELAELKVVNMEKPDEVITFTSPMAEANLKGCHPIQNLGAVETYNRRYLYVTALEIVEHDALDSSAPVDSAPKPAEKKNGNYKPAFNVLGFNPKVPEDFPLEEPDRIQVEQVVEKALKWLAQNRITDAVLELDNADMHPDQWRYAWSFFDSTQRSSMKKEAARLKEEINKKELATT